MLTTRILQHRSRRRLLAAALLAAPLAAAGAANWGHAQDTYQGGLWRSSDGRLWCGGGCDKSINQVCCTISINES